MTLWQQLDPRLHLAAAIGWAVFTVVTLAALIAANLAAAMAATQVRTDTERLLAQFATQVRHGLAMNLDTRRSIVQATAAQIVASSDRGNEALRRHLEAVQAQFPEFSWIGVADERGRVVAAGGGILQGEDVTARPWFQHGRERVFLSDANTAPLLEKLLPRAPDDEPLRFVDIAVPLTQASGRTVVVGAHLSWSWVERLLPELLRGLDTRRELEVLLAAGDGTVLVGPRHWIGRKLVAGADLTEKGTVLVGQSARREAGEGGLDWTIIMREDAAAALATARTTRHAVFVSVLLAGLLSAAAAVWVTRLLTRRLAALASQAQAVQRGAQRVLAVPAGTDEVSRIGATLAEIVGHLQQEKQALETLNAELDARVVERTARIERMADEARHAAITRERLRLARDLHDTLAHSLMALLTQIRLVRKLRSRLSESELETELTQAEEVAASGLTQARAAITQMRRSSVRDTGLGAALQELLAGFRERCGVAATLQADQRAAELADTRAETVFRIVEEALRNVEHHAQAREVSVRLDSVPPSDGAAPDAGAAARIRLVMADDGVGFDPSAPRPGHYGLIGIREQAALIGAALEIHSQPGQGTRIILEFDG